jgi:chromosome segregation ATPase
VWEARCARARLFERTLSTQLAPPSAHALHCKNSQKQLNDAIKRIDALQDEKNSAVQARNEAVAARHEAAARTEGIKAEATALRQRAEAAEAALEEEREAAGCAAGRIAELEGQRTKLQASLKDRA